MAIHNDLGRRGEEAAVEYLRKKGYSILARNWRNVHKELDIIAQEDDELVIVEVKTRSRIDFGRPEEAVDSKKIRRLVKAANAYIQQYKVDHSVRFDILSLVVEGNGFTITHFPNAFYPPMM